MASRTTLSDGVPEKTTARLTAVLKDEADAVVGSAALTTLTLTLYDERTGAILNLRNQQSVLNANGGAVDANGNLTMTLAVADNAIQNTDLKREMHVALFEYTWSAGAKAGRYEIAFPVDNLTKVA